MRAAIVIVVLVLLLVFAVYLEIKDQVRLVSPSATPFFEDYRGNYISEGWGSDSPKGYWKIDGKIPDRVKACFIAIEDKRFYEHSGVDWYAIGRALVNNFSGGPRHGASTIAMQVARMQNRGKRTYWKKLCELVTARLLVSKYGREAVLRQYLCLVPQGNRIHGAAYAARRYFRKPLQDLGWAEAALLAAIPKAPGRMNPFTYKGFKKASERAQIVLKLLHQQQKITTEEYQVNLKHLSHFTPPVKENRPFHSYHAIMNMEEAMKLNKSFLGGPGGRFFKKAPLAAGGIYKPIRTTLDLDLQYYLSMVSLDAMNRYRPRGAGNIAIMVVERNRNQNHHFRPASGKIRGYLGSEYYYDEENAGAIDYARTPRSSGSTLKPFIYALGLAERRYTPGSILADLPFHIAHPSGQYIVGNYDSNFLGPLIYRKALANSRNVPAVLVLKKVGLERVYDFFQRTGLARSENQAHYYGLGMAVGGLYVTLEDLVRAYGILANDGLEFSLRWFEDEDAGISESPDIPIRYLPEEAARQVAHFLSDPLARLPSFGRMGPLEYPFPAAIKTGTSQGYRDAWAVAWSARYIIGAWIGHPNNDRMSRVYGMDAARVVKRIMLHLHKEENRGIHEIPFPRPRGYRPVKLCALSGHLATGLCSEVLLEDFKPGTEPVEHCRVHRQYPVDRRSGKPSNIYTPSSEVEIKTFTCLPPEYSAWAGSRGYEKPPVETGRVPAATVEIRNPVANSKVLLDPETPLKFQTLALKASVTPAVPRIVWIIDGKSLEPTPYPYVKRWPLQPGEHTFQVRFPNANVHSKVVTVTVSEY